MLFTPASQSLPLYVDIYLKLNELILHLMNKLNISAACLNESYIVHRTAQSFTYPYKRGTLMVIRGLCSLWTVYNISPLIISSTHFTGSLRRCLFDFAVHLHVNEWQGRWGQSNKKYLSFSMNGTQVENVPENKNINKSNK